VKSLAPRGEGEVMLTFRKRSFSTCDLFDPLESGKPISTFSNFLEIFVLGYDSEEES